MTTWEEIRDEIAGMLADGQPLEDVIPKLEQMKNEMAKPMTNEEWFCGLSTEEKAKIFHKFFMARTFCHICPEGGVCDIGYKCKYHEGEVEDFVKRLKQPHSFE